MSAPATGRCGRSARSAAGRVAQGPSRRAPPARPLRRWLAALAAVLLLGAPAALLPAPSQAKEIVLPEDGLDWRPSDLPGYALVQTRCRGCHSAHYAAYQPPVSPRGYWDAQVKRMKAVFRADIPDDQMAPIVDYLVRTYGAEAGH